MSAHERPQNGTELVDAADIEPGPTCEPAATCGDCESGNGLAASTPSAGLDSDVKVKLQRRIRRLSMLLTQAGQVMGSIGELVEEVLDERVSSRLMDVVRDAGSNAPEQPNTRPAESASRALVGVPELAQLLAVDPATVRRWRRENLLPPALVVGSTVRWRSEDIDAWIAENREAVR